MDDRHARQVLEEAITLALRHLDTAQRPIIIPGYHPLSEATKLLRDAQRRVGPPAVCAACGVPARWHVRYTAIGQGAKDACDAHLGELVAAGQAEVQSLNADGPGRADAPGPSAAGEPD